MQAACSCHTRLCRRHRQPGSSNRKARSTLQSRWASVITPIYGCRRRRAPHLRAIGDPVGRAGAGRATCRSRTAQDASAPEHDLDACAWVVRAGRAGWMGRTSDARKEIAFPSHLGGAGRAHVEGEWLNVAFQAGTHCGVARPRPPVRRLNGTLDGNESYI